jgi:hypothetical protein
MIRGWAYYAYAMETDPWAGFCGIQRSGPGYVKQQRDWLKKHARVD